MTMKRISESLCMGLCCMCEGKQGKNVFKAKCEGGFQALKESGPSDRVVVKGKSLVCTLHVYTWPVEGATEGVIWDKQNLSSIWRTGSEVRFLSKYPYPVRKPTPPVCSVRALTDHFLVQAAFSLTLNCLSTAISQRAQPMIYCCLLEPCQVGPIVFLPKPQCKKQAYDCEGCLWKQGSGEETQFSVPWAEQNFSIGPSFY